MSPERARTIRGPLRYEVTSSSPQLEAGTPFSVFVKISNPYDAPTVIRGVSTRAPVEFLDVQRQLIDGERERLASQMQHLLKERLRMKDAKLADKVGKKLEQTKSILGSVLKAAAPLVPGGAILSAGYSLV